MTLAFLTNAQRTLLLAALALLLAACAGGPSTKAVKGKDTRPVTERAAERAQLFAEGKFAEAWSFTTPGHRAAVPVDQYVQKSELRPVKWISAQVAEADCPNDALTCEVQVDVEFQTQVPMRFVGRVELQHRVAEKWIRIDEVWYFLPPDFQP